MWSWKWYCMINDFINEDLELCSKCGGMCCKKCGCDYGIVDFTDRTYNGLKESLDKGDKSIVAVLKFNTMKNGCYMIEPTLYIRARNINRDIVDLISMKTRCAQLNENGCSYNYEDRPLGGRNLKPRKLEDGGCFPIISQLDILSSWIPYQKQLRKLVKCYTGMSVDKKISEDVENLIYDFMIGNFDDVSKLELYEIKDFVPMLVKAFPNEAKNAYKRYENKNCNILRRSKKI